MGRTSVETSVKGSAEVSGVIVPSDGGDALLGGTKPTEEGAYGWFRVGVDDTPFPAGLCSCSRRALPLWPID